MFSNKSFASVKRQFKFWGKSFFEINYLVTYHPERFVPLRESVLVLQSNEPRIWLPKQLTQRRQLG